MEERQPAPDVRSQSAIGGMKVAEALQYRINTVFPDSPISCSFPGTSIRVNLPPVLGWVFREPAHASLPTGTDLNVE